MIGNADKTERTALKGGELFANLKIVHFFRPGLAAISGDRRASPAKDEAKESWLIYPGNAAWCGVAWRCGVWHVGVVCGMAVGEQVSNHAVKWEVAHAMCESHHVAVVNICTTATDGMFSRTGCFTAATQPLAASGEASA